MIHEKSERRKSHVQIFFVTTTNDDVGSSKVKHADVVRHKLRLEVEKKTKLLFMWRPLNSSDFNSLQTSTRHKSVQSYVT